MITVKHKQAGSRVWHGSVARACSGVARAVLVVVGRGGLVDRECAGGVKGRWVVGG